jgi:hypothetical protein
MLRRSDRSATLGVPRFRNCGIVFQSGLPPRDHRFERREFLKPETLGLPRRDAALGVGEDVRERLDEDRIVAIAYSPPRVRAAGASYGFVSLGLVAAPCDDESQDGPQFSRLLVDVEAREMRACAGLPTEQFRVERSGYCATLVLRHPQDVLAQADGRVVAN